MRVYLEEAAGAEILTLRMILETLTCSFSKSVGKSNNKHFLLFIYIDNFSLRLETEEWISDRPSAADNNVAGTLCVCLDDGQKITEIFVFFPTRSWALLLVSTLYVSLAPSELTATAHGPDGASGRRLPFYNIQNSPFPESKPNSEPIYR